ncbi:MAG: acyloxyacyl hydrolase [Rhodospirillales bacterium]|nr:acyloxyacyl hydrolase [Rhodospirillales bacterium]MCB9995594.1 acyloxyacyl hydrolase [Rhodospirillales bacterium]
MFLTIILLFAAAPAKAEGDLLSLGIGWYDINDNEGATDFRVEYRWDRPLVWVIEPWAGGEVTSDGAVYGVAGILADIQAGDGFVITPSFGAGLYGDGDGKDLGNTIEFRSQLELGWEFQNSSRVGVAFGHISNASLGDRNPGTEILNVYYHVPVEWF